jgi:type II secretory pathway component PulF
VTDYYNEIIPKAIKKIFGLLEPAIMLGLIVLVGTVVLSVFLPITEMLKIGKGG